MTRTFGVIGAICAVLLAGCGDSGQTPPTPREPGVTAAPQAKVPTASRPKDAAQTSPALASPQIGQRSPNSVADAKPMSVGVAVWNRNTPVGIDLSTGGVVILPGQHN